MIEDVLSAEYVATLLKCEGETVNTGAASGDLPGIKVGRSWVFPRAALVSRLNEKALEESELRRRGVSPAAVTMPVQKRQRRAPVALPVDA